MEGFIDKNPVEPTRAPVPEVKRERLMLEQFQELRRHAEQFGPWIRNALDLALSTGQRREDITRFKFSDIVVAQEHCHDEKVFRCSRS